MAIGHPVTGLSDGDMVDTAITPSVAPVRIPRERYVSADFAALEAERMWPFAWQVACTVDHLPEPGRLLRVRGRHALGADRAGRRRRAAGLPERVPSPGDGAVHRGRLRASTSCAAPTTAGPGTSRATLREVPSRKGFGADFRNEDYPLFEAQVDTWGPLVFVNVDPDAMALSEYMDGMWHDADWARLDEFHCDAALRVPVRSNWKVVAEGFSDTYHVQGIHPEMLFTIDDVHAPQRLWTHCGVSYQQYGLPSPRVRDASDQDIWDNMIITQGGRIGAELGDPVPEIPEGQTLRDVMAEGIRRVQAERGVDLSDFTTDQLLTLSQYNLFPNTTVLIWGDMMNLLIARPGPSRRRGVPHDVPLLPPAAGLAAYAGGRHGPARGHAARPGPQPGRRAAEARPAWPSPTGARSPRGRQRGGARHQPAPQPRALPGHRAEPARAVDVTSLEIADLVAREEIRDVVKRLARGTDRLDEELMASCYHPDGFDDHNSFRGSGAEFARWVVQVLPHFAATHHFIADPHFRSLAGDVADLDTYCIAHHVSRPDEAGRSTDMVLALRYDDRFERRGGEWRIARRVCVFDWTYTVAFDPAASFAFDADFTVGARDRSDQTYR